MDKPKRKNEEPGFWDKLSDSILLAKSFERELDLSPQECTERLLQLNNPRNWYLDSTRAAVEISEVYDQTYDFEVRIERKQRSGYQSTAKMAGVILIDKGSEKTLIRAKMIMDSHFIALAAGVVFLAIGLYIFSPHIFPEVCPPLVIFSIFPLISLITEIIDSSTLYNRIFDTFPKESKAKKKKNDETE
jgi:hypothetical protein